VTRRAKKPKGKRPKGKRPKGQRPIWFCDNPGLEERRRAEVLAALELVDGRVKLATEILGIARRRFYYYFHRWGLWPELARMRRRHFEQFRERAAAGQATLGALVPDEDRPALPESIQRGAPVWKTRCRER